MNCLLWNCRGANKPNFRRSIRYILKRYKTDVLAVFETHAGCDRAIRICSGLGFENSFRVDAIGQSGGLWLLWRSEVGEVEIVKASDQFIHAKIVNGVDTTHLVVVYAAPTVSRRSNLWMELKGELMGISEPLIIGGDFNTIVCLEERTGGNGRLSEDSLAFGDWINEMMLIDMGFKGSRFTWRRGRMESTWVAKRLDRVLCCPRARLKWQEASVTHLPFLASDHAPLYVQLCPEGIRNPRRRPFRFEAAWIKHDGFRDLLASNWKTSIPPPQALIELQKVLRKWNKDVFGNIHTRKEKLLTELVEIQGMLERNQSDDLLNKEVALSSELDVILEQEETLWFQKSREKWVAMGDRNTTFFHTSTIIRRNRNRVERLKGEDGRWVTEKKDLEEMAVRYYTRLYSLDDVEVVVEKLSPFGFTPLSIVEKELLDKPFTMLDVEKAIRNMEKYKAPGPDGFQPVFFHECWREVGTSISKFVIEFFESGILPRGLNNALVVLISKVVQP